MNKIRIIVSVVLGAIVLGAWIANFSAGSTIDKDPTEDIILADECMSKKLYQRAIEKYEKALSKSESQEVRDKCLLAYKASLDDGTATKSDYSSALEKACSVYPQNVAYWETLLDFYVANNDYNSAYNSIEKIQKQGVTSDKINALQPKILYSYTTSEKGFEELYRNPSGYYTVCDNGLWGVLDQEAEWKNDNNYEYISPISENLSAMYSTENDNRIIDGTNVVQAKFNIPVQKSKAYGNGRLPVYDNETMWRFLNCDTGEYASESFDDVSAFTNSIAAVKKDGVWKLIDTNNAPVCETEFSDIKLFSNGEYVNSNIMVAAVGGVYGLYDAKGNSISNLQCEDIDTYLGENIAVKVNGKWGYANKKGDIVIEPQFENAKSFSNGLAAVCKNGQWGYINDKGQLAIDYKFAEADYFTYKGITFVRMINDGDYFLLKRRFAS